MRWLLRLCGALGLATVAQVALADSTTYLIQGAISDAASSTTAGTTADTTADKVAGIETPLTTTPGDALRGRAIVADRQKGLCLLCHSGPFAEVAQQGNLAPNLAGAGSRMSQAQLRMRIVDSRRLNPDSLMPAYFRVEGLHRVGMAWQGLPLLQAQEVEDVVAFLASLQ